jgi:hypothetical protein
MNETVIDGDKQPNFGRTRGRLDGWDDKVGRWTISLVTKEGLLRFQSSDPQSAAAVAKTAEILRGDSGLQSPIRYVEVKDGVLLLSWPEMPQRRIDKDRYPSAASAERDADLLAMFCGSGDDLLRTIAEISEWGGANLLADRRQLPLSNGVTLSWSALLEAIDVEVLGRLLISHSDSEWDEKQWRATTQDYSDSCRRLDSLEFTLGPLPGHEETLVFGVRDFVMDGTLGGTFKLLFGTPPWVVRVLLGANGHQDAD